MFAPPRSTKACTRWNLGSESVADWKGTEHAHINTVSPAYIETLTLIEFQGKLVMFQLTLLVRLMSHPMATRRGT